MSARETLKGVFHWFGLTFFNSSGKVNLWTTQEAVLDSGKVLMVPTNNGGHGIAQIGDGEEYGRFVFASAGAVTLVANSANVGTTEDNDTTFNIYDAGDRIGFNNELGSTKNLFVKVWWT
jgi:hypothetical protein